MADADIRWAVESTGQRVDNYQLYRNYYNGLHRLAFATNKWQNEFGRLFSAFAVNMCPAVVDAIADKLQITGVTAEDGEAKTKLADLWKRNRLDRRAGEVHSEALNEGDGWAIVWQNEQKEAVFYPQRADYMAVEYDDDHPGQINIAAKLWPFYERGVEVKDKRRRYRLNLYYPDRCEKYITALNHTSGNVPDNPDKWDPWNDADGKNVITYDYGRVPVFHWANNAAVGQYGRSELLDVLPVQDAFNKSVADMLIAMEFASIPQKWVVGVEIKIDPDTKQPVGPWKSGPGQVWQTANSEAKMGNFAAAELEGFVRVQDSFASKISQVSRTPVHHLLMTGDFPSGEALHVANEPLKAKWNDRTPAYGNTWEDCLLFMAELEGTIIEDAAADWRDTFPQSEEAKMASLEAKDRLGIPQVQLWKEMGYSEEDIERMQEEKREQQEEAARLFDAGTVTGFERTPPQLAAVTGG